MATATATQVRPLGDRVVVKVLRQDKTAGGIVLPDTAQEKPQMGEILSVGSGRLLDDGTRAKMEVQKGQKILFAKYAGTEVKLEGDEVLILSEKDILGIVE